MPRTEDLGWGRGSTAVISVGSRRSGFKHFTPRFRAGVLAWHLDGTVHLGVASPPKRQEVRDTQLSNWQVSHQNNSPSLKGFPPLHVCSPCHIGMLNHLGSSSTMEEELFELVSNSMRARLKSVRFSPLVAVHPCCSLPTSEAPGQLPTSHSIHHEQQLPQPTLPSNKCSNVWCVCCP